MGRRRLPWIKLWSDSLSDPKMKRLSIAERGCWDGIQLLAGQSPVRGKLMLTETQPMTIRDISKALSLTTREVSSLRSCISKLVELGEATWDGNNCLEVINFKERQEVYPSDFQNYHEKAEKLRKNSGFPPEKLQKEEEGGEETIDVRRRRKNAPKPNGLGARDKRADPRVNEIFEEVRTFLGYPGTLKQDPIPSYGREGQAVKRMLSRGFTLEAILECWKSKVSQRGGEFVSMTWVNEDIADPACGGEALPASSRESQNQARTAESGINLQRGEPLPTGELIQGGRRKHGEAKPGKGVRPASDFADGKW